MLIVPFSEFCCKIHHSSTFAMTSKKPLNPALSCILTTAEWDIIESKTFKCQLGTGDFEKRNVEISIRARESKDYGMFVITPNPSHDHEDGDWKLRFLPADRCSFDPIRLVLVLKLKKKLAAIPEMIKHCQNDPNVLQAETRLESSESCIRVLFDPKEEVSELRLFARVFGWNGEPLSYKMSHKAFPNDIPSPFILMKSKDQTSLRNFYQQEILTDFVLVSSDNQKLKVHRVKIAAVSEVFLNMLSHDTIEKREGFCRIADMDFETLKLMVDSFYGLPVEEKRMDENCQKLYVAANKYQLLELQASCSMYLGESMEVTNVVEMFRIAKDFGDEKLLDAAVEFVRKNYDAFVESDGVLEVAEKIPEYSREFFKRVGVGHGGNKRTASQAGL